jgi:hypothetical protein
VARTSATKGSTIRETWAFVVAVFAASRLLFLGTGAFAAAYLPQAVPVGDVLEPPGPLNYWAHWDGAWYSEIATGGYSERAPTSTAFFPLYPLLMRLAPWGGLASWGVLISLSATLLALFFLYRIAENLYGSRAARAATLALAFFPTAFFLNAVYTEALFLALTAGSVWAARVRRDLLLAGLLGALVSATRNLGFLLLIPLLFEWLRDRREFGLKGLAGLALVPAGLLGYVAFLWGRFGEPLVFARQQAEHWGRELANPFTTLERAWQMARDGSRYLLDPELLFLSTSPHEPAALRARGVPGLPRARLPALAQQAGSRALADPQRRHWRGAHRAVHHLALGRLKSLSARTLRGRRERRAQRAVAQSAVAQSAVAQSAAGKWPQRRQADTLKC